MRCPAFARYLRLSGSKRLQSSHGKGPLGEHASYIIDDVRLQVDLSPSMHEELQVGAPSGSTKL